MGFFQVGFETMTHPLPYPPAIGISGKSGSGKTLLIESLVPRLRQRGARVAVIKHCTHRIEADTHGKDSDRVFKAGADILAAGPSEAFARFHENDMPLWQAFRRVAVGCDVCLVEGYRGHDIPRIQILPPKHARTNNDGVAPVEEACNAGYPTRECSSRELAHHAATADFTNGAENSLLQQGQDVLFTVTDALAQVEAVESIVWDIMERSHRALPVMGLIIPSGEKPDNSIKRIIAALEPHVQSIFLSGKSSNLQNPENLSCLPTAPNIEGPFAGILGAMRWHPAARWIVVPEDSPLADSHTVEKILLCSSIGVDAVLSPSEKTDMPHLALCEPTCLPHFEEAALEGNPSLEQALAKTRIVRNA